VQFLVVIAGLAAIKSAFDRGDLDETARQGQRAGAAIVEGALHASDRPTVLAGIVAAQAVDGREELLPALLALAAGPDRRIAIPAARAARAIADRVQVTDDLPEDELDAWRADWVKLAIDPSRWIEVRIAGLEVAAALAPGGTLGFDLASIMTLADPALRATAVSLVPQPAPVELRAVLSTAVANDTDPRVALGAAQALCADLAHDPAGPVVTALGDAGLARIKTLVLEKQLPVAMIRDASRCLKK